MTCPRARLGFAALAPAALLFVLTACAPGDRPTAPLELFGSTGAGPGQFNYPRAIARSADGWIVVVDKGGRVQRLDARGRFLNAWTMPETLAGKPTGLCVAPDGRIFIADTHYARVMVFSPQGEVLTRFGAFGDAPGQFRLPTDVLVDFAGCIYVSEYGGNDRISKFSPRWEYLFSFGGRDSPDARTERPQSLAIAKDGTLWVADACNHRVLRFDSDGRLLKQIGELGGAPGQFRFPYNVEPLSDGTLVVTEQGNNRVQRLREDGTSLGIWGRAGRAAGELAYPWALVVDAADRAYILDSGNNRIQVIDAAAPSTWRLPR